MGSKKDKKKKNQKKSEKSSLVQNKQKDLRRSTNETSSTTLPKDKITITIDSKGNTLTLKRIGDNYICTDCLVELNLNKSETQSKGKSKPNLQCSICLVSEFKVAKQNEDSTGNRKQNQQLQEVYNNKIGNGIKGLQNLGNTCFFNSIMQNLTHIPLLRDVFLAQPSTKQSPIHTTSPMTMEMHYFFMKMYKQNSGVVSPAGLFTEISKKSPRFRGFKQQDSHELLRYLLDGLISEEQNTTKNRKDPTYLDKIFGGELISIVRCFHCGYVSKTIEPFLDLSLPIPLSMSDISLKKSLPIVNPRNNRRLKQEGEDEEESPTTNEPKQQEKTIEKDENGNRISKAKLKKMYAKQRLEEENNEKTTTTTVGDEMEIVPIEKVIDVNSTPTITSPPLQDGAMGADEVIVLNESNFITSPSSSSNNIQHILIEDGADNHNIVISDVEDEESDTEKKFLVDSISIDKDYIKTDVNESEPNSNTSKNSLMDSSIIEIVDSSKTLSNIPIFENYENLEYQSSIHSSSATSSNQLSSKNGANGADDNLISFTNTDDSLRKSTISDLESSFEKITINPIESDNELTPKLLPTITNTTTTNTSTTTPQLQPQDRKHKLNDDNDIQKVPIDLRGKLPTEAHTLGTLLSCLLQFTNPEKLEGENGFICSNCTKIHKEKKELEKIVNMEKQDKIDNVNQEILVEESHKDDSIAPDENITIIEISDDEKEDNQSNLQLSVLEISKKGNIEVTSPNSNQPIKIEEIPLFGDTSNETTEDNDKNINISTETNEENNTTINSTLPSQPNDNNLSSSVTTTEESSPLSKSAKKKAKRKEKDRLRSISLFESVSLTPKPITPLTSSSTLQKPKKKNEDEDILIRRNASKQYLLSKLPPYLTIHLKRFMQTRGGFQKNSKHIDFPIILDLSPFINTTGGVNDTDDIIEDIQIEGKKKYLYRLNGLVEHLGGINSGHYVAYVYDEMNNDWYYISDSHAKQTTLHALLTNEAYVLFYKREGENTEFDEIFNLEKYKDESQKVTEQLDDKEIINNTQVQVIISNENEIENEVKVEVEEVLIENSENNENNENNDDQAPSADE